MKITVLSLTKKPGELRNKTEYRSPLGEQLAEKHDVDEKLIFSCGVLLEREIKKSGADLVIVTDSFKDEKGFRSRFARIINKAERKAQEIPSTKAKKRKKEVDTVTYMRKKTHIFPIELDGKTAYAFTLGKKKVAAVPSGVSPESAASLPEAVEAVFEQKSKQYPDGYSLTERTLRVLSFSQRHLPIKSDPLPEKVRKSVKIAALCVFLVAAYMFVDYMYIKPMQNEAVQSEIRTIFYSAEEEITDANGKKIKTTNWKKLRQINSDIKGWIKIDNTKIDYPIVQAKGDNKDYQFYLKNNVKKEYSDYGAIFIDYRSKKGMNSKNIIIHGHHMEDGSMFGNLLNYGSYSGDLGFYKKSPIVKISTPSRGNEVYKIISVFKSNVNPAQGEYFDFYCPSFKNDSQFMNYVYNLRIRSLINCPVNVNEKDQLLTLVTCSYEFTDFRTVVVARRCRKNESKKVDVSAATLNGNPVWPQCYYSYRGGSRPVISTFKAEYKKGNIKWYDGNGKLKGAEQLPTSIKEETQPTTAKPTEPKKVVKKTKFSFKFISRGKVIKKGIVKKGTKVKIPTIKTFTKGGYKYSLAKWKVKGFGNRKYLSSKYRIVTVNNNFVMKAVFKKVKINKPKPVKPTTPPTKPTKPATQATKPTKPATKPVETEPDTEPVDTEETTDPVEE